MDFEIAFAKAGVALAGPDPLETVVYCRTSSDQLEIELLVEAGFTPVEAIHIATENGAPISASRIELEPRTGQTGRPRFD